MASLSPAPDGKAEALEPASTSTTASEAYLARLARRAFLHLWSYPNLYRDQGKHVQASDGKEICDLLVVFGNELLIFSDKHCMLKTDKELKVSWRRWYRDAVVKSAGQIEGAERWLRQHPDRVFLDRACTRRLPIPFPKEPRIHRIVTCRGAAEASSTQWGGAGSLFVTNQPLADCVDAPFHLGCVSPAGEIVHVFDEVALDAVLDTLNTVEDFCTYLAKRERFFRSVPSVVAAGEEELLAYYLMHSSPDEAHEFPRNQEVTEIIVDEGFWADYMLSRQRAAKLQADKVSYCWDELIEKFSYHLLNGSQYLPLKEKFGIDGTEQAIRWMARECRVRRRLLARGLLEMMPGTKPGQQRRRLVLPSHPGDPYWVFVVLPRPDHAEYRQYRELRQELLIGHCYVVKYLHPEALDIVGIAVEPSEAELSEDLVYMDGRTWTTDLNDRARILHEEGGIFRSPTQLASVVHEFPMDSLPDTRKSDDRREYRNRERDERKRRKRLRRAQASQRKRSR